MLLLFMSHVVMGFTSVLVALHFIYCFTSLILNLYYYNSIAKLGIMHVYVDSCRGRAMS